MQGQQDNLLQHGNLDRASRVLERMENQNTFKEMAMDFKVVVVTWLLLFCTSSCMYAKAKHA